VVASELAASAGLQRDIFKRNVRSLKALGLTLSQPVGYRLSPRGQAYLDRL
jgi:ribosomal protein S19E (S16A)